jgi:histidyl-tRNA synthetase
MALGRQLKLADARGAAWAVVIGPDDRARGEVMIKDLRAGGTGQRAVAAGSAAAELARMAGERGSQGGERGNG